MGASGFASNSSPKTCRRLDRSPAKQLIDVTELSTILSDVLRGTVSIKLGDSYSAIAVSRTRDDHSFGLHPASNRSLETKRRMRRRERDDEKAGEGGYREAGKNKETLALTQDARSWLIMGGAVEMHRWG